MISEKTGGNHNLFPLKNIQAPIILSDFIVREILSIADKQAMHNGTNLDLIKEYEKRYPPQKIHT